MPTPSIVTHLAWNTVKQLQDADILHMVKPTDVPVNCECYIPITILQDMHNLEFLNRCEACGGHWTISLIQVLQDLLTYQTMRHLMDDFARRAAREAVD